MTKKNGGKVSKTDRILSQIEFQLERQNSLRRIFLLGLVRGFGTALGATVLVAIATSITLQLSDSLDLHSFLAYFFSDSISD